MKTEMINLSVSEELFLRYAIRVQIMRKYDVLDALSLSGSDVTWVRDDISELQTLYRKLFGIPFKR